MITITVNATIAIITSIIITFCHFCGLFKYRPMIIFEHEIINWFENIRFDIKECTLDPRCLDERGACFSCMYIPEFVCYNFNQLLDRDVFLGKHRFKKGFW